MAAVLIEYLDEAEPLTFDDVASQDRIDGTAEQSFVETIIIPAARQMAETKSGAAIRKARYVERLGRFPEIFRVPPFRQVAHHRDFEFALAVGQVVEVDSITWRAQSGDISTLDPDGYELIQLGRETLLAPAYGKLWPRATEVTITYQAGADLSKYPGAKAWMLLAAAWAIENRELFLVAATRSAVMEMPAGYADALLGPITVPPRF
jgi:hypothetical protein